MRLESGFVECRAGRARRADADLERQMSAAPWRAQLWTGGKSAAQCESAFAEAVVAVNLACSGKRHKELCVGWLQQVGRQL